MTRPHANVADGATWLFVPGDRPDRFDKAAGAGADQVILDLEDAVAPIAKEAGRQAVTAWLRGGGRAWVRINAAGTQWHGDDLAALSDLPGLVGVMLPKAEAPDDAAQVRDRTRVGTGVVALVETARGVQRAAALADSGHVDRLAFGSIDLALDLGADETDDALLLSRTTLVLASRAAGLRGPIDGITTVTDDPGPVAAATSRARSLGFAGKLCIHPRQVGTIARAFAPTEDELAWAQRIDAAVASRRSEIGADGGAFALDGSMVDRPVIERARAILARRPATNH